ncbi:MAG: AGE family epimerase/isomerase [Rhizobiaceae bacterium]|nr:AGE family epimerase/isomerase [Rhizobiaceae bacterium]
MNDTATGPDWTGTAGPRLVDRPAHRRWLLSRAFELFDFFQPAAFNPAGGFFTLDELGRPNAARPAHAGVERQLHDTTRMVHCFAVASLLGLPGADRVIDHGMDFLWRRHRDSSHGGYFWAVDDETPTNPTKQAYGHAFVLLAASSAKVVGHPLADRLIGDVTEVLRTRFWEETAGATSEEYAADWSPISDYRGQNSNMHLTEALMAAHEATGDTDYLAMAGRIADLIVNRHAREQGWRVAEHFDRAWNVDIAYAGDPMFRPRGTTPGHALEWSRLLVQLWQLGGRQVEWLPEAAASLFKHTTEIGWDHSSGGFFYTLDWSDRPDQKDHFWWPCAEGIAAAAVLGTALPEPFFETWYRRIWGVVANHFIDRRNGSWLPELDAGMRPVSRVFTGRPDIYHAVQACLIPLLPADGSITRGLMKGDLQLG